MRKQFLQMEQELDQFHKKNQSLELRITELNQKLKASDKELRRERQRVRGKGRHIATSLIRMLNCKGSRYRGCMQKISNGFASHRGSDPRTQATKRERRAAVQKARGR